VPPRRPTSPEPDAPVSISAQLDALVEVLDHVRSGRAQTRPELIARTGLSRAVVAQRVSELLARGLLEEAELGASTGGRAPRILRFRATAGFVLAADLGATHTAVAAVDLAGNVLAHAEEPSDIAAGPEQVLGRVEELFDELLEQRGDWPARLWGVGIGVPGPVEFGTGTPVAPPIMPGWDRYPVRDRFGARYDVPVWVDNDVNVMALGEVRAGVGRDEEVVVYVKVGTGIGAGIVVGGRLLRGAQGSAGDIGHIQVTDDETVVCRCGKIGCLEALAGGAAIRRLAEAAARDGGAPVLAGLLQANGRLAAEDVAYAASHGDVAATQLFDESGRRVGGVLASVVNLLNPSLVVVGGGVANAGDGFLAAIRHTVYGRSLPLATRELQIRRGTLGHVGGVIGAAAMVVDELFARDRLARWLDAGHPGGRPELAAAAA
jgi:glucokinase-like ROK family protein